MKRNLNKKRTLKDSITPLPYYANFNYPLEGSRSPSTISEAYSQQSSSDVSSEERSELRWSAYSQLPSHMRRGTMIYKPNFEKNGF